MTSILSHPEQFIFAQHSELKTSSLKVAEAFGKDHANVLKAIDKTLTQVSDSFRKVNFDETEYEVESGIEKTVKYRMYEMTKDGFMFLVMGFTGKKAAAIKESYINAFNQMHEKLFQTKTITPAQRGILFNRVKDIAKGSGRIRAEVWDRFKKEFKLASYKDLPADQFDAASAYLDEREQEYLDGVEMLYISEKELAELVCEKIRALEGEYLAKAAAGPRSKQKQCQLPPEQVEQINRALDHLSRLFHPFNAYFGSVQDISMALRGRHPKYGGRRPDFVQVLPDPDY